MNTYYKDQLAKLTGDTTVNIKMVNSGGETNWLSLNDESANALVEWLKENYNISEPEDLDKFGSGWSILDIKESANINYATDLSDDQARKIAANISRTHDANIGINWDVIHEHIRMFIQDNNSIFHLMNCEGQIKHASGHKKEVLENLYSEYSDRFDLSNSCFITDEENNISLCILLDDTLSLSFTREIITSQNFDSGDFLKNNVFYFFLGLYIIQDTDTNNFSVINGNSEDIFTDLEAAKAHVTIIEPTL